MEHHVPAHKSPTFSAAVEQLRSRCETLAEASEQPARTEQWTELLDIVGWLPELAGDSDLRRADWEQVQRISQNFGHILEPFAASTSIPAAVAPQCRSLLAELATLAKRESKFDDPAPEQKNQ